MNEKYSEEIENKTAQKSNWWIWAIVLALVGLVLIASYLYNYKIENLGNCSPL
jgi:hypothetical protein